MTELCWPPLSSTRAAISVRRLERTDGRQERESVMECCLIPFLQAAVLEDHACPHRGTAEWVISGYLDGKVGVEFFFLILELSKNVKISHTPILVWHGIDNSIDGSFIIEWSTSILGFETTHPQLYRRRRLYHFWTIS